MKKWFIKHAVKSLLTSKNSEGPAALTGFILTGLAKFMPPEMLTADLEHALMTISTTAFTYAAFRFYKKARTGDGS